jgi:hypothetical protein
MRYILLIIALALAAAGIYSVFGNSDNPPAYDALVAVQPNPFYSSADSAAITWRRAKLYLETYPAVFGKEGIQITDSVIAISYYNGNKKGNSLRIERKQIGNSIRYKISWWYSRNPETTGAKEIALFMQQGIDKNDQQFKK